MFDEKRYLRNHYNQEWTKWMNILLMKVIIKHTTEFIRHTKTGTRDKNNSVLQVFNRHWFCHKQDMMHGNYDDKVNWPASNDHQTIMMINCSNITTMIVLIKKSQNEAKSKKNS
jgi:hypothetical protein